MSIRDQAAAFLLQLNPAVQSVGANIATKSAGVLQKGANVLADVGDAAFKQGGMIGSAQPSLSGMSNVLHSGSQNLLNLGQAGQAALGLGGIGTAALAAGTAATGVAGSGKKKKERMAGRNLGAQLGVQMPIVY